MADPRSIVPYHDPYDNFLDDEYLHIMTGNPNPTLANLDSINVQQQQQHTFANVGQSSGNVVEDPINPLDDPMMWDICNDVFNQGKSQEAGPSNFGVPADAAGGTGSSSRAQENLAPGGQRLSVWPPPPVPFGCTCCLALREIIHTDGNFTTKLEIHGRLGLICHAVLETWDHITAGPSHPSYHMFDFCKKTIEEVKHFLQNYCDDRKNAGFVMVQDPLSVFYDALMVGLDSYENTKDDEFYDISPTNSGESPVEQTGENEADRMPRTNLALQRERAGRLTLNDFQDYFHLPIEKAARKMNICPTVVKKICRRAGLARWPHRKIKAFKRQISNLQTFLNSNNEQERVHAQVEIQRLQQEIANLCAPGGG